MNSNKIYLETTDHLVSNEKFRLEYLTETDMLVTQPIPENLINYYESNNYISHKDEAKTLLEKVYQTVKKIALKRKLELINKYDNTSKTILDIGCGTGEFLITARKNNWNTVGVEINDEARNKSSKKNITTYKVIEEVKSSQFNIITLWHVLEHLKDLNGTITKISSLLDTDGTLVIAVPNYKSYDANYYKEYWAAYDTPRHLWHFSQKSISTIFEKHNLKVVRTLPMYFDSYYVSLLSEKYKTGKSNYFKAFYRGMLSNLKAKGTGEYSSLIYVLQKA
ncbi:class I SAM-dependent methyltransferase [Maribacter sp. 1_2014MBL_MicDiv]|uniref:class I SAM-dependent methyltransferase n=1 Tax=Maribacter sp. 1_2014MBL_MicDiv TaxID=1644130 RepID=UPI0008F51DA1|nr:class I SAM-dependent methyltransferase [Maribacter sp. 1_2014MBL_MicDiv]APA64294.1 methyltransferase [Maribacter sp. 1_2014MBL_MicDiv]